MSSQSSPRALLLALSSISIGTLMAIANPAASAAQNSGCTVRDRSTAVAIVTCPTGLTDQQLREAGETACAKMEPCSAWIWTNVAAAPKTAPPLATGIPKEAVLNSTAVWDNDGKQLVKISKEK